MFLLILTLLAGSTRAQHRLLQQQTYTNAGDGKCVNMEGQNPEQSWEGNIGPYDCRGRCDDRDDCYGYSVSNEYGAYYQTQHGNCILWLEPVQAGGAYWHGADCIIKDEAPEPLFTVTKLDDLNHGCSTYNEEPNTCVKSANYPNWYTRYTGCTITLGKRVRAVWNKQFEKRNTHILTIAGTEHTPYNQRPVSSILEAGETITWDTNDYAQPRQGWRVCFEEVFSCLFDSDCLDEFQPDASHDEYRYYCGSDMVCHEYDVSACGDLECGQGDAGCLYTQDCADDLRCVENRFHYFHSRLQSVPSDARVCARRCSTDSDCTQNTNSPHEFCGSEGYCIRIDGQMCDHYHNCGIGDGDCDSNSECAGALTCGKNNFHYFHPTLERVSSTMDVCELACSADSDCDVASDFYCGSRNLCIKHDAAFCETHECGVGDGSCQTDEQCDGDDMICAADFHTFHPLLTGVSAATNACISGTRSPSASPSLSPTGSPSVTPTELPSFQPTVTPTFAPSVTPTELPSFQPTVTPTNAPSVTPSEQPSFQPTVTPTFAPSSSPSTEPTLVPTTSQPSEFPSVSPTGAPSASPSVSPSSNPTTSDPSEAPSHAPSGSPSVSPSRAPSSAPSTSPTTSQPSQVPTAQPSTSDPTLAPTQLGQVQFLNEFVDLVGESEEDLDSFLAACTSAIHNHFPDSSASCVHAWPIVFGQMMVRIQDEDPESFHEVEQYMSKYGLSLLGYGDLYTDFTGTPSPTFLPTKSDRSLEEVEEESSAPALFSVLSIAFVVFML